MLHKLLSDNVRQKSDKAQQEQLKPGIAGSINLDDAYLSGVLAQLAEKNAGNVERVTTNTVPVINRVSAGYPKDFTDLSYPPRVADDYIGCPDVHDRDAFAARVHGDSMTPKYREGDIVVFSPAAAPKNGDDCFVRFADGQTTFKRVFFENDEAGESVIRLQPRNEKYRPKVVRSDEVAGLYKAVYRYQRVDED
jgi:phage repressor protein C with HTH and peptisase S24 domain